MAQNEEMPVVEPGKDAELDERSRNAEDPIETSVIETKSVETKNEAKTEDPFAVGRERLAQFSNFLSSSKEKASGIFSKVGKGIAKIWSWGKGKSVETAAAILSADEIAKKTAGAAREWKDEKIKAAVEWKDEKIYDTAEFFSDAADSAYEWGADKVSKAAEFTRTKADQIKNFGKDKIELAGTVAAFVKDESLSRFDDIKAGFKNRFQQLKGYGQSALENAHFQALLVKEKYDNRKNRIRIEAMKRELEQLEAAEKRKEELKRILAQAESGMELLTQTA